MVALVTMTQREHPSDLRLDGLRLGELEADAEHELRAHLDSCEACSERFESFERQAQELGDQAKRLADAAFIRAQQQAGTRRRVMIFGAAFTATMLALFGMYWVGRQDPSHGTSLRLKGGDFTLRLVAKRGSRQWTVKSGEGLVGGDQLRFVLIGVQRPGYLYLLTIDQRQPTIFAPAPNRPPQRIEKSARFEVPGAMALDKSIGAERAFALVCEKPLPSGQLDAVAKKIIAHNRPSEVKRFALPCSQASFLFNKPW